MFGWFKRKTPEWIIIMGEEFNRLQESFLLMQRNHKALQEIVSELSSTNHRHSKELSTLFQRSAAHDSETEFLSDQFRFFKRKQSKEKKCQKIASRK